jgi:hypothetical protein
MAKKLTQRQLRNESGEIMRALDAGESFIVTPTALPSGSSSRYSATGSWQREAAIEAFAHAAPLDAQRFRADLDRLVDQDPTPRG